MARVLVATQPWGVLWATDGSATSGGGLALKIPAAGQLASINTTVYSAATGTGTVSAPAFVTNVDGELPGYVNPGSYTLTIGADTMTVEATSGPRVAHIKDYGALGTGDNIDTPLANAVTALGANGGTIIIDAGSYVTLTPPSFQSTRCITLQGDSGVSAGATCATVITYAGTATRPIDARASFGFRMRDIQFLYTNASFVSTVVDLVGASYADIDRCYIGGSGVRSAAKLIDLNQAQGCRVTNNVLAGAARAIGGMAAASFANAVTVQGNTFKDLTAMAIQETGEAWKISGNIFQNLVTAGGVVAGAGGISCTVAGASTLSPKGVEVTANWFGDATVAGTWVLPKGTGWYIAGNSFGGGSIGIDTRSASTQGVVIVGNRFDVIANAVVVSGQKNLVVIGNDWTNCTLGLVYSAMPLASLMQDNTIGGGSFVDMFGAMHLRAGAVSDGLYGATPPDGTMAADSTNHQLALRMNTGTWWKFPGTLTGSKTHDWASVANGANANTTVTVTGAVLGDNAMASMSVAVPAGSHLAASVTAADTVTVTLFNATGGALDLASGTLRATVFAKAS
jgi:hypothetical protein